MRTSSRPSPRRCAITGNGVNVFVFGAFYVTRGSGKQRADAFLYNEFSSGWEWWPDFDRSYQNMIDVQAVSWGGQSERQSLAAVRAVFFCSRAAASRRGR